MQRDVCKYSRACLDPGGQHPFCPSKKKKSLMEQEEDLQDSMCLFVAGKVLDFSLKKWAMVFSLHLKKQGCYGHVL